MGPLHGVKIIELVGIGPGPFAGTLLSDMGAEVVRVERAELVGRPTPSGFIVDARGRRDIGIDLKHPDGVECVLRLVERADALIEGFRPGVTERLGLGPDVCLARNPRVVYGRMTGWGQEGPLAHAAGHDINYISLAGALAHFGRVGRAAHRRRSTWWATTAAAACSSRSAWCAGSSRRGPRGRARSSTRPWSTAPPTSWARCGGCGRWVRSRRSAAPTSSTPVPRSTTCTRPPTAGWVSIGSIEPQFYAELLERTGVRHDDLPAQMDRSGWPVLRERLTAVFKTKTRAEWTALLEGTDVCFAPVLPMSEAVAHPHVVARGIVVEHDGIDQPAPAPRFSRTAPEIQGPAPVPGQDSEAVLADWGFAADEIAALVAAGAVRQAG